MADINKEKKINEVKKESSLASKEIPAPEKEDKLVEKPDEEVKGVEPKREVKKIKEIKEEVEAIEDASKTKAPPPVSSLMKDEEVMRDLKDVMSMDKPKQVKVLVYLAFKKGIHHAAAIARKLKDPYIIDEFHDTLVDELYGQLLKKKKIKQK